MKNFLTNKTLSGATAQYMTYVQAVNGSGLRKEYLLRVVAEVMAVEADGVSDALAVTIEPLEADKRYNRNLLAFIRACSSYPTRAKERLEAVTVETKMDDILAIGRGLKKSDDTLEAEAVAVDTVDAEEVATLEEAMESATEEIKEAVTKEREARPNVVTVAQTLATLKTDELLDMLYSEADTLAELVQNFKGTKEQTAVFVAKIGEAIAYAETIKK